ncbi:hypothetical protein B0H16DRAFT_1594273 [Mycena metata]|uniref:Uncharacterized protein n=1 Tax=Mycena metata TaxID=1033252 RepID=A0AAD7HPR3_9AGAR|nr:hypothetical protein B0H16DRAFT_1594273 [Mycena metata]
MGMGMEGVSEWAWDEILMRGAQMGGSYTTRFLLRYYYSAFCVLYPPFLRLLYLPRTPFLILLLPFAPSILSSIIFASNIN